MKIVNNTKNSITLVNGKVISKYGTLYLFSEINKELREQLKNLIDNEIVRVED